MASRVAVALDKRTPLPRLFLDEVLNVILKSLLECKTFSFFSCGIKRCQYYETQRHSLTKEYHKEKKHTGENE